MIDARVVTARSRKRRIPGHVERAVLLRLRALAAAVPAGQAIVELGAWQGRSTAWLLLGASEGHGAHVTTVDPWGARTDDYAAAHPDYSSRAAYKAFRRHMKKVGAHPGAHTVLRGYAAEAGRDWAGPPVGLLWHDAEHTAGAVAEDLAAWAPHVAPGGVAVLHDAGNPAFGVRAGAERALPGEMWDWGGAETTVWARHPARRGALFIRRKETT